MTARKMFLSITVALVLLVGCAAGQGGGIFGHGRVDDDRQSKLAERIRLLDIDWAIILKDDPPQPATVPFRGHLADANQALAAGKLEESEKALADAEAWMTQARPQYYREHEAKIVTGSSKETSDQLIAAALELMQKGLKAKEAGDQAGSRKYLEAAMEEGELSIAASGRTLQGPEAFTHLVEQMGTIYAAAGHPEKTPELHSRIVRSMQAGIDASGRQIQQRLDQKAPGFETATLQKDKAAVDKAIADLNHLNEQYRRQVEVANGFAPGEIRSTEYQQTISVWSARWTKFHEPPPISVPGRFKDTHEQDPNIQKACTDARDLHNQMKKDAASLQGSGIVLEETEIYTNGTQVLIRGKIQNLRNQPILNPQITVTGGVFSEVKNLDYTSMNPPQTTTFLLALQCYPADTYYRTKNQVPAHELLLIFKEPNGTERKLLLLVPLKTGND